MTRKNQRTLRQEIVAYRDRLLDDASEIEMNDEHGQWLAFKSMVAYKLTQILETSRPPK